MQSLASVRLFVKLDSCIGHASCNRTLLQSHLLRFQHFPCAITRVISGDRSVEGTDQPDDIEDKKGKVTSKKYIYYKEGKAKYSTGEPLSSRHVSRISNKYFFGPLLETKREKARREKQEAQEMVSKEKRGEKKLLQKDTCRHSSENLLIKIIKNSKGENKKNTKFDVDAYDKVAAVYSQLYNTSNWVKKSTCESLNKAPGSISNDTFNKSTPHYTNNDCKHDVSDSRVSATTSIPNKQFALSAQLHTTQIIGSNLDLVQNAPSTSPNLIEVDNCKYEDAPRYLDLNCLLKFPLFRDNSNPLHLPFNASHHNKNSDVGPIMGNVFEGDTGATDPSSNDSIVSIGYRTSGSKCLPSVSRILSETMPEASKIALAKWEAKMIAELGDQGFQDYKKELFSQGSLLHECIHALLQHSQPPSPSALSRIDGFWRSVEPVLAEVRRGQDVAALESRVIHPHLYYAGVLDCVSVYRDTPVIVEWKTSTKPKRTLQSTYDNPLQLAAYLGALQHDPAYRHLQVQSGLLAFAYSDGSSCDTHVLSRATLERYWQMWLARLATFWKINSVGTTVGTEAVTN